MSEINWFSSKQEGFGPSCREIIQRIMIQTILCLSKDSMKRFEAAMLLFQLTLATPNAPALIRQTELIRSHQRIDRDMWARCGKIEQLQQGKKSRKDEKQMENFSPLTHKNNFSLVAAEICARLEKVLDSCNLLPEKLHLPAWACSCKRLLILNH